MNGVTSTRCTGRELTERGVNVPPIQLAGVLARSLDRPGGRSHTISARVLGFI